MTNPTQGFPFEGTLVTVSPGDAPVENWPELIGQVELIAQAAGAAILDTVAVEKP